MNCRRLVSRTEMKINCHRLASRT
ncbi:hypothetical protein A2U01_0096090, partial [Trifolium medium]|nr:hypothetical protein [Trifolium medium]